MSIFNFSKETTSFDHDNISLEVMREVTAQTSYLDDLNQANEYVGTLQVEAASLTNSIAEGVVTQEVFVDKLSTMTTIAENLFGSGSDITIELMEILALGEKDVALGVEEFTAKRRGFIDRIISKVVQNIDNMLTVDAWKTLGDSLINLTKRDDTTISKLQKMIADLKQGKLVIDPDAKLHKNTKRKLGIYTAKYGTFDIKHLEEYYKTITEMIVDGSMSRYVSTVHDSLVQSKDNAIEVPYDKKSLEFFDKFKYDISEVYSKDTRIILPTALVGNSLRTLQIVQDDTNGIDTIVDILTIPGDVYEDMSVGKVSSKDLEGFLKYILGDYREVKKTIKKDALPRLVKELLKNLRSIIATMLYSLGFGIFAIKRFIRQIFLANKFIKNLVLANANVYLEYGMMLSLALDVVTDLTKRSK